MEKVIAFLSALKENNNRSWFEANKDWYLESRHEFIQLCGEIIKQIALFDPSIGLLTAKDCVFRIYRDVRFSHDKSPYKTNMGAYLSRGGKKVVTPDTIYTLNLMLRWPPVENGCLKLMS